MQRVLITWSFIAALTVAAAFTVAQADVYKWIDAQGVAHYSDEWVPGSEIIKTGKNHPVGYDNTARTVDQKTLTAGNQRAAEQLKDEQNARATQQDVAARRAPSL